MWTKLGGRKFIGVLLFTAVGTAVELYTTRGMSTTYGGFLALLYTSFTVGNWANSREYMRSKQGGDVKILGDQVEALKKTVDTTGQVAVNLTQTIHDAVNNQPRG